MGSKNSGNRRNDDFLDFLYDAGSPLLAVGEVIRRTKFQGIQDGREWEKRVFRLQCRSGLCLEVSDFTGAISPEAGEITLIPLRVSNQPYYPLMGTGGERF